MATVSEQIGQRIKELRKAQNLTQKELGEKLGIGEPTVNKYENGKQNPTVETLTRFAEALNVNLKVSLE